MGFYEGGRLLYLPDLRKHLRFAARYFQKQVDDVSLYGQAFGLSPLGEELVEAIEIDVEYEIANSLVSFLMKHETTIKKEYR